MSMKWVILSWRNIWRHRRRSLLTMSILTFGVVALLSAIGFMLASFYGLRESTIRGGIGHIQILPASKILQPRDLQSIEELLHQDDRVKFSMRRVAFEGLISNGPNTVAVMGKGVSPEHETRLASVFAPIVTGTGLPIDGKNQSASALLGTELAKNLGVQVGNNVTLLATTVNGVLNAMDVDVVGTFTTGIPELDARQVLLPLETGRALLDTKGASAVVVVLNQTMDTDAVANALRHSLPNLRIQTWQELAPFYGAVTTLYRNIFAVFGVIILFVVSLSLMNTIVMAITERVREMGTMLALGITRQRIRGNFAVEGAIMGALGSIAGIFVAAFVAIIVTFAHIEMPPPPGRSLPYPLIIFIDPYAYAILFVAIVLASAVAAWLPTRRLVQIEVVEALRQS